MEDSHRCHWNACHRRRSLANPKSLYGRKPQALCECVIRNHEATHSTGPFKVQGNGRERSESAGGLVRLRVVWRPSCVNSPVCQLQGESSFGPSVWQHTLRGNVSHNLFHRRRARQLGPVTGCMCVFWGWRKLSVDMGHCRCHIRRPRQHRRVTQGLRGFWRQALLDARGSKNMLCQCRIMTENSNATLRL